MEKLKTLTDKVAKSSSTINIAKTAADITLAYASNPNAKAASIPYVYRDVICMLLHGVSVDEYLSNNKE